MIIFIITRYFRLVKTKIKKEKRTIKLKRAVILDTSAIMYRSHFALMGMRNSSGMSTGATFGFINTLESVIREFRPDYLVVKKI